jgi:sulfonate transport system substrate-binding protein
MKKTIVALVLTFALLFSVSACSSSSSASVSGSTTPTVSSSASSSPSSDPVADTTPSSETPVRERLTVRIALAQEQNEPTGLFQAAKTLGYLQEELDKVNAELEWFGFAAAGPAVNEALVGGSVDLALYGNLPPVTLAAKGFDLKVISFTTAKVHYAVYVAPDSPIQTLKDVEGKKVIVGRGTITDEYWGDLVETYGIDESKVEIVNDPANGINIFAAGQAEVLITADALSFVLSSREIPFRIIESTKTSHPEFASQAVFIGRTPWLNENGDVAEAILRAYIRAYDYVSAHFDEAPELFSTDFYPTPLIAASIGADPNYLIDQSGEITEAAITRLQKLPDFLLSHGYIDNTIDVKTFIDDSYYNNAAKEVRGN